MKKTEYNIGSWSASQYTALHLIRCSNGVLEKLSFELPSKITIYHITVILQLLLYSTPNHPHSLRLDEDNNKTGWGKSSKNHTKECLTSTWSGLICDSKTAFLALITSERFHVSI